MIDSERMRRTASAASNWLLQDDSTAASVYPCNDRQRADVEQGHVDQNERITATAHFGVHGLTDSPELSLADNGALGWPGGSAGEQQVRDVLRLGLPKRSVSPVVPTN